MEAERPLTQREPGWPEYRDCFDSRALPAFAARHWRVAAASVVVIERRLSIVARARRNRQTVYLRLSHPSIRQPAAARAAYAFQDYLARAGAPVCAPIRSETGNWIEWLPQGGTRYFAGLVHAAPGRAIAPTEREPRVFRAWGRSIAQLHEAAQAYRPAEYAYPSIFDFLRNIRPTALAAEPALRAQYRRLTRWLEQLPRRDFALTHGDMHPANAFWDGRQVTIIDFDEPVYNWIWVDFGRALLDFYERPANERRRLHEALLAGYGQARAIDAELHGQLARFMQLRGLLMHLWSLQDDGGIASGPAPHQRNWALTERSW